MKGKQTEPVHSVGEGQSSCRAQLPRVWCPNSFLSHPFITLLDQECRQFGRWLFCVLVSRLNSMGCSLPPALSPQPRMSPQCAAGSHTRGARAPFPVPPRPVRPWKLGRARGLSWGCCHRLPLTGWLKQQFLTLLESGRPRSMSADSATRENPLPIWQMATFSLSPYLGERDNSGLLIF